MNKDSVEYLPVALPDIVEKEDACRVKAEHFVVNGEKDVAYSVAYLFSEFLGQYRAQ